MPTFFLIKDLQNEKIGRTEPYFALISDNWDDYSYRTTYALHYVEPSPSQYKFFSIGDVKILDSENKYAIIPEAFEFLSERYCSLGQSDEYYNNLASLGNIVESKALKSLRDVAFNPKIYLERGNDEGFQYSLLRSSYAEKLLDRFKGSDAALTSDGMSFQVSAQLFKDGKSRHRVEVQLSPGLHGLHRIWAIIGKNGVGKTKLLNAITIGIAGVNHPHLEEMDIKLSSRPKFSHVFASSFSSVDPDIFSRISIPSHCHLIRLIDSQSPVDGCIRMSDAQRIIKESPDRMKNLMSIVAHLTGIDSAPHSKDLILKICRSGLEETGDPFQHLSSGEYTLLSFVMKVIAHIEDNSLIILDEPETHLHPTYIVLFFRILTEICRRHNSYAILSTHSPLIVQNLPSSNVAILQLRDGIPVTSRTKGETFGESASALVESVFGFREERSFYSDVLSSPDCDSEAKLARLFPDGVGMHAKTYWRLSKEANG
jgi:predicted ATPase